MPINMTDYKMVYNERVYNVLSLDLGEMEFSDKEEDRNKPPKIKTLRIIYINEDGNVKMIEDEAWRFQFIHRNKPQEG